MTSIMEIRNHDSVGCIVTRLQTGHLRIPSRDMRFISFATYPEQHLGAAQPPWRALPVDEKPAKA